MSQSLPFLQQCAPPFFYLVLGFLAVPSQWLFSVIDPHPLTTGQAIKFDILVLCIAICYARTWLADPGRLPQDWSPDQKARNDIDNDNEERPSQDPFVDASADRRNRWCRKCDALKPPRAHHCKTCGRCIPKMDHHCPWVANCVSNRTLPHFVRFLIFSVLASIYLECFLFIRFGVVWRNRKLPSYLGPTALQLTLLLMEALVNTITLIGMGVVCLRTLWCLGSNKTTIEEWELERHHALLRRSRYSGGFLEAPGGYRVKIVRQEFPWDIGIFSNIAQGMGSKFPFLWLWPLAPSLAIDSGLAFPDNGLEGPLTSWPPPDPDRMFRHIPVQTKSEPFTQSFDVEAFKKRQEADLKRYQTQEFSSEVHRRKPFHERLEQQLAHERKEHEYDSDECAVPDGDDEAEDLMEEPNQKSNVDGGEESWRNSEGERLADFGVDEDVEFYDEEDLPLAELMRRRKAELSPISR